MFKWLLNLFKKPAPHPLEYKNSGFFEVKPEAGNFELGAGLEFKSINPLRDWETWLPDLEIQFTAKVDLMRCVTEATLNVIETQVNRLIALGQVNKEALDYFNSAGYIKNGKFQTSKRYTATMSGTTKNGNSLLKVADSVRHDGILPEVDWPTTLNMSWEEHYSPIPQALKDKAKKIYDYLNPLYEWVKYDNTVPDEVMYKQLEHAPLVIAVHVCSPWNSDKPVPYCGIASANHAVELYKDPRGICDSYDPQKKVLGDGYIIPYAMKFVVEIQRSAEARALLEKLDGKYIIRSEARGQVYFVTGGKVIFYDSEKQPDRTIPIVNRVLGELKAEGRLIGINEENFNLIS